MRVNTHIDCFLFRPHPSKNVGWNVAYMDPGLTAFRGLTKFRVSKSS
jgi:hypothetical protein